MSDGVNNFLRMHLGNEVDDETIRVAAQQAVAKIASAVDNPKQRGSFSRAASMEMIVAVPMIDTHISLKLANLIPNALHPSGVRQYLAAKTSFDAASAGGPIAWIAFLLAMTVLAARAVPFAETCILHKAWRLASFDRVITIDQLVLAGPEIAEEYGVIKVASADIETYLNALVRLGCMTDHPKGYALVEKVALKR